MFSENFGVKENKEEKKAKSLTEIADEEDIFIAEEKHDKKTGISSVKAHTVNEKGFSLVYLVMENGVYRKLSSEEEFMKYHNSIVKNEASSSSSRGRDDNSKTQDKGRFSTIERVFFGKGSNYYLEKEGDVSPSYSLFIRGQRAGYMSQSSYNGTKAKAMENITRQRRRRRGITFYNKDGIIGTIYYG